MELTKKQEDKIITGFADYMARQGAKSIIREASPTPGYYVDGKFYTDKAILVVAMAKIVTQLKKLDK